MLLVYSSVFRFSQRAQYLVSAFVVGAFRHNDLSEKKATTKSTNVTYTKNKPTNGPKTINIIEVFINSVCVSYATIACSEIICNTAAKLMHSTGTIAPMNSKSPAARNRRTPERVDNTRNAFLKNRAIKEIKMNATRINKVFGT